MWPSTLYPERTYRFFKNVYDNYGSGSRGDKKSHQSGRMGLEQQHQSASTPSSGASTPQLERRGLGSHHSHPHHPHHPFHHPRHSLPSPPLSIFSSSSSDLAGGNSGPSTPSSSFRFGLQHHNNQRTPPPPPMTRLFAYSKSVATDMKHRFHAHIARLPKIESIEDSSNSDDQVSIDSRGDMMAQSAVDHHPHHHRHHHPHQLSPPGRGENIGGHQRLYYRSSSPVFGQRQMYAASTRLHHSEPQSATGSVPLTRQRPLCDHSVEHQQQHQQQQHFLHSDNSSSGPCQRSSPSSMSPNGKSAAAAALSARRLSSSVYRSALANTGRAATYDTDALGCRPMLSAAAAESTNTTTTRTVLLDKFASEGDVHNRAAGGLTLCGGREVGLTSIYISRVAANSAAEKCGLGAGDQILSANYISFLPSSSSAESTADSGLAPNSNSPSSSLPITCKRAYEILDNGGSESILLTVLPRSKAFPPARRRQHHLFAWVDAEDGRPVSPPPPDLPESLHLRHSSSPEVLDANIISSGSRRAPRLADLHRVGNHFNSTTLNPFSLPSTTASSSSFVDAEKNRGVTLTLEKDVELGLVIRGGIEFGLGIYVARVQADSLADQAGLRVGDQILSLNGQDFGGLLHDEAVDMLASAATLNMSVLYVGKVPSTPHFFSSSPLMEHHPHHHQQHPPLVGNWPPPQVSAGNSAVISPRHSPHHRGSYYPLPPPSAGEMVASSYGSTSPTNKPPSPRLIRQSPHHHRMTPLSHSNSSPTSSASSSSAHHHQHEALHHSHSYREQCSTNLGRYEKRDTPTLLITDSDNRNLPHHLHQQQQQQLHPHHHPHPHHLIVDDEEEEDVDVRNVVVDDDEDDDELYVLTVDRAFSATSGMGSVGSGRRFSLRKRLLNSKSEEDEMTLDEEAAKYLTEKERLSLAYYRNEYETKAMPVETMVALLSELFDNEEKYSLLFRLYHVIRPEDVDRFDELLYNRELLAAVKNKYLSGSGKYRHLFKQQSTDSGDGAPHYQVGDPTVGQSTAGAIPLMQRPPPEHLAQQQQQQQQQQLAHLHRHSIVSSHGQDTRIDLSALDENDDDDGGDERRRRQQQQHQYHLDLQQQQHENTMAAVNSRLGRRESALLVHRSAGSVNSNKVPSPNSAAYRKTFMTRRHSSGTSDTPIVRDTSPAGHCVNSSGGVVSGGGVGSVNPLAPTAFHHHHGSYPLVADERRWSIANPAESTSCRRPSSLFNPSDLRLRRSPSPSVTFAQQNPQQQHRSSREELEVPNSSASSSSQRISLSRKGSNSSQCCLQETIPEHEDGHLLEAPNTPTIANNATTSTLASASGPLRGSGNHLHVPPINGVGGGGGGDEGDGSESDDSASGGAGGGLFSGHLRVRRHRSLPSPTFTTEKLLASNFPQHQRSNSFRLPSHRATSEPNGRWRIKVKKSRPFLGIVIEGGDNVTTQTQPRIISIHQSGAAIECGDLHVGHIILEIDGHSTEDMNHAQVAQAISRAYYNTPHKDYIEFLVREKSRAEFDLRRSSFMLLNNSFE